MDVERTTTMAQAVGLLVGGGLALAGTFVDAAVGDLTLTALGVGIVAAGFVVAAIGSFVVSSRVSDPDVAGDMRVQAGLQGLAAVGFAVVFVASAANLGLAVLLVGAVFVLAAVASRSLLERRR
ncbi:hypothetical protein [Halomarina oriensis]|uniref:Uncharacterized protein n=1 Tax=Halomarina oriensis TaxID=671145 RepID=A0A6B0GSN7_9EURY|nr:hypothetical protein [Halomarina oriensis]MWG35115.1 hypothetical protein [Halomarina oriensis]